MTLDIWGAKTCVLSLFLTPKWAGLTIHLSQNPQIAAVLEHKGVESGPKIWITNDALGPLMVLLWYSYGTCGAVGLFCGHFRLFWHPACPKTPWASSYQTWSTTTVNNGKEREWYALNCKQRYMTQNCTKLASNYLPKDHNWTKLLKHFCLSSSLLMQNKDKQVLACIRHESMVQGHTVVHGFCQYLIWHFWETSHPGSVTG